MSLFAIGDIHGCYNHLIKALAVIEQQSPGPNTIVFLGDYIDRGPQSREVVETLMRGPSPQGDTWICLRGNHEQLMIDAHTGGDGGMWLSNGGLQALASWGGKVPKAVIEWCQRLALSYETASHYFVHAGIMPGVPLEKQSEETRLWIRHRFLNDERNHGKHIVHGHTPKPEAELLSNRTNLDTGACFYGTLSIGRFDGSGCDEVFSVTLKEPVHA